MSDRPILAGRKIVFFLILFSCQTASNMLPMVKPFATVFVFFFNVLVTAWYARLRWLGRFVAPALVFARAALSFRVPGTKLRIVEVLAPLLSCLVPVVHHKNTKRRRAKLVWVTPEDDMIFGIDPQELLGSVAEATGVPISTLRSVGIVVSWILPIAIPCLITQWCSARNAPNQTANTTGQWNFPTPPTTPPRQPASGTRANNEQDSPTDVFDLLPGQSNYHVLPPNIRRELAYPQRPVDRSTHDDIEPPSIPPSPPASSSASSVASFSPYSTPSTTPSRRLSRNSDGTPPHSAGHLLAQAAATVRRSQGAMQQGAPIMPKARARRDAHLMRKGSSDWSGSLREFRPPRGAQAWH